MLNDLELLSALETKCGNRYAAIKFICYKARKLNKQYNNHLLDSKVISWVLTGEKPNSAIYYDEQIELDKRFHLSLELKHVLSVLDEYLCYVDDIAVSKSVRLSIRASQQARHLVYVYHEIQDEFQSSRVRVLTRMIWYSL